MRYKNITAFLTVVVSLTIVLMSSTSAVAESNFKIVEGDLQGYDNRSVKVQGWHYFLCPLNDSGEEDKGRYIYDPEGREVEYGSLKHALEVKLHITKGSTGTSCVKIIKILKLAD